MSSASVTYTFANSTTADASQVNQNFADLVSTMNSHLMHKGETGLEFANAGDNGKKIRFGTLAITTTAAAEATGSVAFSAMGTVPKILATIHSALNQVVRVTNEATTGFDLTIAKRDGSNYSAGSQNVDWVALG